jgi:hypothetical protein
VRDGAASGESCHSRAHVGVGGEGARTVAVGEHAATAAGEAIPVLGGGDLEALHAAGERDAIVGLDDELDRARGDAELDDAEVGARE